jgi:ZIP family zinc transporter
VAFEYYSARWLANQAETDANVTSLGLYAGILADMLIDGMVIGVGATLTLTTGVLLALGIVTSTAPLAFVTTATAKQPGVSPARRRQLAWLFMVCIVGSAVVGNLLLANQPLELRLMLIAFASGFLLTTVTQSLIPEANREGEPSFAGLLFVGGISLYAVFTVYVK